MRARGLYSGTARPIRQCNGKDLQKGQLFHKTSATLSWSQRDAACVSASALEAFVEARPAPKARRRERERLVVNLPTFTLPTTHNKLIHQIFQI